MRRHLDVVDSEAPHAALPADALDDGAEEWQVPPGGRLQLPVRRLLGHVYSDTSQGRATARVHECVCGTSREPEMALRSSGPASCRVRRPACSDT